MTMSEEDQKIIDELMEDPRIEKGFPERKKEMPDTNGEAPMSVTIRGYYKGYSVLLTKRDPGVSAEPLLKSAMSAIDWMAEKDDWKPSWKDAPSQMQVQEPEFEGAAPNCPECGSKMVLRNGSKGKFWGCKNYPNCRGTRQFDNSINF